MNGVVRAVCGCALAVLCFGARAGLPAPDPVLAVDLGDVTVGEMRPFTLCITNAGACPVEVANVQPSCECIQVLAYRRAMPPGATNSVLLRFVPDRVGDARYQVEVRFADDTPACISEVTARVAEGSGVPPLIPGAEDIAPDLLMTVIRDPEPRWYVKPTDVLSRGKVRAGVSVVDVRGAARFEACRIPEALNMPLHVVKTKAFLRSGEVVLVDEGLGGERLERECARLAAGGFRSVSILKGGMNLWRRQGGPVSGSRMAGGLPRVSPGEFLESRDNSEWVVVNADCDEAEFGYLLPRHVSLASASAPAPFGGGAEEPAVKQPAFRLILVVDRDGTKCEAPVSMLGQTGDASVFCLAGGLAGLQDHLRQLTAMRGGTTVTTQTARQRSGSVPKPCAGCL